MKLLGARELNCGFDTHSAQEDTWLFFPGAFAENVSSSQSGVID